MAMPQRDDPPSRCALRRIGTIGAIKRRAAEKKADEERKSVHGAYPHAHSQLAAVFSS